MSKEIKKAYGSRQSPFEQIKRTNEAGVEFWSSRDFAEVLGYDDYRNFERVIEKARLSCFNSGHRIEDHFVDVTEMIEMGSTELAANPFRATQAEEKLRRDEVMGKEAANRTHREVGAKVRKTIQELGGTMPEELPTVESIKKIETKQRKRLGKAKTPAKKKSE
ncbi:MAG: hypothetical protein ACE5IR_26955 [bacterium]